MRRRAISAALLALVLALNGGSVPVAARQRAAADAARAADRIRALQREAEILAHQERTLLGELRTLEVERDLRAEEARTLDAEAAAVAARMESAAQQIASNESAIEAARPELNRRLVNVYKLGRPGYARVLLGLGSLRDAGRAMRLVSALVRLDQQRVKEFSASIARLSASRAALEPQATHLRGLQTDARKAADLAASAAASRERFVHDLDARRDLNAQMVGELEVARDKLQKAITDSGPTVGDPVVLPLRAFRGEIDWPTNGRILSRFGEQRPARFGTSTLRNGLEIEAVDGAPVRAVHDGRVAFADVFAGFGQLVIVDHGGLAFSLYGYLGSMTVTKGSTVAAGQTVGVSGRAPAGHAAVYFELRIDGHPVDPLQWLKER